MQTFAFYIEDDRYTVPTLKLECFADEMEARRRAVILLDRSPHHRSVEVCLGGRRLAILSGGDVESMVVPDDGLTLNDADRSVRVGSCPVLAEAYGCVPQILPLGKDRDEEAFHRSPSG